MDTHYEVVIIGGSFAGLSAAMTLGRALRNTLIIDAGSPCNQSAPHAHNLLTHDGDDPMQILSDARNQVQQYKTVHFVDGLAVHSRKVDGYFEIETQDGKTYQGKKLLFATGLKDVMPDLDGFAECWGKSILHCPYCHGYEVKGQPTGILGNGKVGFEMAKMILNWTDDITLFTDGKSVFSEDERRLLHDHKVIVVEDEVKSVGHENGNIAYLEFRDGKRQAVTALYAHPHTRQSCDFAPWFGCKINEHGCIDTDVFQRTNIYGVYAAGDCSSVGRALSVAMAAGTVAGMFLNKELVTERFA